MLARLRRPTLVLGVLALLAGCATYQLPPEIREPPAPDVSVADVQGAPSRHVGQFVRWGGRILAVRNRADVTEIEVLATALGDNGVPSTAGAGAGRFIAEIPGFREPAEYPKDRRITVAGTVTGLRARSVGEYPYSYPVVAVTQHRLWAPPAPEPYWHRYPYYGSPLYPWGWGYPWYPWHPWYPGWPYYW
jgi:outer membrane lipoprotein